MKKIAPKKRRLLLWIGIPILLLIVLGVIFVSIGVNTFLKPTIKHALEKLVVDGSDSLYSFSLGDYTVGPGGRSATLSNLSIQVDSNRYRELKAANRLPPLIFSIKVASVAITGLHPWDLWRNKKIIFNELALDNSVIVIQQQPKRKDSVKTTEPKSFYELIKPSFNTISVDKIDISNSDITFKTIKRQTQTRDSWHLAKTRIRLSDIRVDSLTYADTARILYASNLQTSFDTLSMKSTDGLYRYSLGKTEYDFKKRSVELNAIKMIPNISQAEFNSRFGHQKDRFTVSLPKITVENFNASALIIDDKIEAKRVNLLSPVLEIYKDATAGPDPTNKVGTYPHQLLLNADSYIDIDKIAIADGRLSFTMKSAKTSLTGGFKFTNMSGTIVNVTNQEEKIALNPWCKANIAASFMGNNEMTGVFNFDLARNDGHFVADAHLKSLKAADVNAAFRALAKAELESFVLDDLKYHIEGNDGMATADVHLLYHDLKLTVLKTDDEGKFKKKGLISLLANLIKIYDQNPENGKTERVASGIKNPRVVTKNFFGYAVFTLLKSVQEVVLKGKNKTLPGL